MRLDNNEFKLLRQLQGKQKDGTITDSEKTRLAELVAKKASNDDNSHRPGDNSFDWWNKYSALISDSANIAWNTIKGIYTPVPEGAGGYRNYSVVNGVRLNYFRGAGTMRKSEDPINYQMRMLWLDMHRKYRGMGSYEWADLAIVIRSIVEAFADIERAKRLYGSLMYFNVMNRSIPDQLLQALGFYSADITGDRVADFRYQLNYIIEKARSLCLPKGLGILDSYLEIDGNIFRDSDSTRAVWYLYDTELMAKYDATALSTGGCMRYATRSGYPLQSFANIITDLTTQFNALLNDSDVARICSDIIACYGMDNVVTMSVLTEDYRVEPVNNEIRKMQLHNTILTGSVRGTEFSATAYTMLSGLGSGRLPWLTMYQEGGVAKQSLCDVQTNNFKQHTDNIYYCYKTTPLETSCGKVLVDFWQDDVSPEQIVEMTRQTAVCDLFDFVDSNNNHYYTDFLYGANVIVEKMTYYYTARSGNGSIATGGTYWSNNITGRDNVSPWEWAIINQIDWHPQIWLKNTAASHESGQQMSLLWDMDNYVAIHGLTLHRMHDACMLSGWKFDNVSVSNSNW
jgi:hypothetical protein